MSVAKLGSKLSENTNIRFAAFAHVLHGGILGQQSTFNFGGARALTLKTAGKFRQRNFLHRAIHDHLEHLSHALFNAPRHLLQPFPATDEFSQQGIATTREVTQRSQLRAKPLVLAPNARRSGFQRLQNVLMSSHVALHATRNVLQAGNLCLYTTKSIIDFLCEFTPRLSQTLRALVEHMADLARMFHEVHARHAVKTNLIKLAPQLGYSPVLLRHDSTQ